MRCRFTKTFYAVVVFILVSACSRVTELEVAIAETIKIGTMTPLTIVRAGNSSVDLDLGDKDGFNYYFSSYPAGNFLVEEVVGKENDYCRTTESNEVSDGAMHNEVNRDMLIKEKQEGEITIAIACHKKIFRFYSADSVVNIQMVVEDADDKVRDTVVFAILRTLTPSRPSPKGEGGGI